MRVRIITALATMLIMLGGAAAAQACTDTWTGPGGTTASPNSGDWGTPTNWSTGLVPVSADDVCITGSGTYTVSFQPYGGTHYGETASDGINSLTLGGSSGTQTLEILGESADVQGNWYTETTLDIGNGNPGGGMAIGSHGVVVLDATADDAPDQSGSPTGGNAVMAFATGDNQPFSNAGTIVAESSDSQWSSQIGFGATLTNTGTIDAASGTLTLQGASPELIVNNTGTVQTATGASLAVDAGDGSSFTNDGAFTNNGATTITGSMHFVQAGGSETGNPIQVQGGATLDDSAGSGSFLFNFGGGFLTGTIPAGQTVEVQGTTFNCSGNQCQTTTLGLGGNSDSPGGVTNRGTLELDAPGSGSSSGGNAYLTGGTLTNDGTLSTTVEDSNWVDDLNGSVANAAGGTISIGGKTVSNATVTNDGMIAVAPAAVYEQYGGTVTNNSDGTLEPEIAGPSSFGSFQLPIGSFNAGGTLSPTLAGGYTPSPGQEFDVFALSGSKFSGTFAAVGDGFTADYRHESASPAYVGVVYGGAASLAAPRVLSLAGGAGRASVKLSCSNGRAACAAYAITGTVTEHLKGKHLTAVSARAGSRAKKTTKVVKVAGSSGHVAAGKTVTVSLKLNRAGEALLKRFGRLKVRVTVTVNGKKTRSATVTITKSSPKKKR